jgi:hypothetical protein
MSLHSVGDGDILCEVAFASLHCIARIPGRAALNDIL